MKKILLLIILLIPINVYAKCNILSGNGNTVGDTISCGDNTYTVFSTNNNTLRLLDNSLTYDLDVYKSNLINKDININNIDILSYNDLNEFIKVNGGGYLPNTFTNIDEYLNKKYSYLWNMEYSLKYNDSFINIDRSSELHESTNYLIRPYIDISIDEIKLGIDYQTDNGKVILNNYVYLPGEPVSFGLKPDEGYILDHVVVLDSNNNDIELDGLRFIMPNSDVLIKAYFIKDERARIELSTNINEQIKKNTSIMIIIGLVGVLAIILVGTDYIIRKK